MLSARVFPIRLCVCRFVHACRRWRSCICVRLLVEPNTNDLGNWMRCMQNEGTNTRTHHLHLSHVHTSVLSIPFQRIELTGETTVSMIIWHDMSLRHQKTNSTPAASACVKPSTAAMRSFVCHSETFRSLHLIDALSALPFNFFTTNVLLLT